VALICFTGCLRLLAAVGAVIVAPTFVAGVVFHLVFISPVVSRFPMQHSLPLPVSWHRFVTPVVAGLSLH
jgi:hypothetical protein